MLSIVRHDKSKKGHRMVVVKCSFCESEKSVRYTALPVLNSCGCAKNTPNVMIGEVFKNNCGLNAVIVQVVDKTKIKLKFLDGTDFEAFYKLSHIKAGMFKNPLHPNVHGVGYFGVKLTANYIKTEHHRSIAGVWNKMISRCYNGDDPAYRYYGAVGVTVSEDWLNFQNFLYWCVDKGWEPGLSIDKDLLKPKDGSGRIYSKDSCCLIPQAINSKLVLPVNPLFCYQYKGVGKFRVRIIEDGVRNSIGMFDTKYEAVMEYKRVKELSIRNLALVYEDKLSEDILQALSVWEIDRCVIDSILKI